jgi:hypothetical protein
MSNKVFRSSDKWVNVTRSAKGFYFAVGYKGHVKSHKQFSYSFDWIKTWSDAKDMALLKLAD